MNKKILRTLLGGVAVALSLSAGPAAQASDTNLPIVSVGGEITGTETWYSTNIYQMDSSVYVLSNAVLNIEPGTLIWGTPSDASDTNNIIFAALFVCRGGKIYAEGTRTKPIVFTAQYDYRDFTDDYTIADVGEWAGVVLLGNARINSPVDGSGALATPKYDVYEGLADLQASTGEYIHRFGGNDDDDNSGVMRYVSIRHGGATIDTDKEINGLSLGAVGRGTTIDHVEAIANADDGFEWFGGTVNAKYLVSAFCEDEEFDIDEGYRGKGQFWFGIHPQGLTSQYGGEWNGEPHDTASGGTPQGNWTIYNMTLVGSGADRGLRIRDYAAPQVYNAVFTEFANRGIDVQGGSVALMTNGTIHLQETIWSPNTGPSDAVASNYVFNVTSLSNVFANPLLTGISYTSDWGLDPRPQAASPALTSSVTAPDDGFFTPVTYKGAFTADNNWAVQWTAVGEYMVMSYKNAGEAPLCAAVVPVCAEPTLSIQLNGGMVKIAWDSDLGCSYQLMTNNIVNGAWGNYGSPVVGDGSSQEIDVPVTGDAQYFYMEAQ